MAEIGARGRILQVHPTRACNLRCGHCYSSSGPEERGALAPALLRAAIGDAAAAGYDILSVSGGEPLLYAPLAEIADAAHACGMAVTVTTNGLLLDRRRLATLHGRVDAMAVSLDGRPEAHDRMRGRAGAFAAMRERLVLLRERDIPFGIVYTLTAENVGDIPWAAGLAAQEGATLLQIHPLEPAGRAAWLRDTPCPDQRLSLLAWALAEQLRRQYAGRLRVEVDLALIDVVRRAAGVLPAGEGDDPADDVPFSELVSPLVVESDGTVAPLQHGFARSLALGNLNRRGLAELMTAYRARQYGALRRVWQRTLSELSDPSRLPVVDWYQEVAQRAGAC